MGTSILINEEVHRINSHFNCDATLLWAPTGVAENNISGKTIHSSIIIPAKSKNLPEMSGEVKINFETDMINIKFVIIDKASMLGLNLYLKVDARLRATKPQ